MVCPVQFGLRAMYSCWATASRIGTSAFGRHGSSFGRDRRQVSAEVTRCMEADNKLVTGTILRRLFDPATELNDWQHVCYGLWNADGMIPPPYLGKTFDGAHTHYLTSGSTVIDSQDIEVMIRHVKEHGYGTAPGNQFRRSAHPRPRGRGDDDRVEGGCGVPHGWPATGVGLHPECPSARGWISNETIHGPIPGTDYNGLQVWGSYAGALLIQSNFVPKGYVAVVAASGSGSDMNPVAVREHSNTAYQGLRHIPGHWQGYPLQDSFFARGFGVGTRHRGAAVVCQITASPTYVAPSIAT